MLNIGSIVCGTVSCIEPYGYYVAVGPETVLVLGPQMNWSETPKVWPKIGDEVKLVVVWFNEEKGIYRGSTKHLVTDLNPYLNIQDMDPNRIFKVTISIIDSFAYHVDFFGVLAKIPVSSTKVRLEPGMVVHVRVAHVDPLLEEVTLELADSA